MKITITESTPTALSFKLSGATYNTANALRRAAINSVQCFAINTVTVYENTSAMFDEYIAHRIGLVPLLTPKGYDEKDEVLFTLEAEGPVTVYSKDMKSSDKSVKVANENIPLIKLGEGQHIKFDCKAVLGTGMKSSKFQPGIVTYNASADGKEFSFYIESFGQMTAKEILERALAILNDTVKEVNKGLGK